jgi:CheY-like chemotaxis protein
MGRSKLHVARDGMQALLMLAGHLVKPDLVILDLNMPNISGHAMLEEYHPNDVPVVVFSSSWNDSAAQCSLASGARAFVRKPTDLQAYEDAVCGMIEKGQRAEGQNVVVGLQTDPLPKMSSGVTPVEARLIQAYRCAKGSSLSTAMPKSLTSQWAGPRMRSISGLTCWTLPGSPARS